jgi:hypothetical protein
MENNQMWDQLHTSQKGSVSQAYFTARCLERGWKVCVPVCQHDRYDILLDRGAGFMRVQIKTGRYYNDCINWSTDTREGSYKKRRLNENDADLIGIFYPNTRSCYLLPIDMNKKRLRFFPKKRPSGCVSLNAKDFEI